VNNGIFTQDSYDNKVSTESQSIKGLVGNPTVVPLPYSCSLNRWDSNKLVYVIDTRLQNSTTITFTTSNLRYNINWGDGYIENINFTAAYTPTRHTYGSHGIYIIQTDSVNNPAITGASLIGILSFGTSQSLSSLTYTGGGTGGFSNTANLYFLPRNFPIHSSLDLGLAFSNAFKLNDSNISLWDTSKCTSMRYLFQNNRLLNQPLNSWDTSNVTSTQAMFNGAVLFNQDLSSWNVRKVTIFDSMFNGATNFNGSLSGWALGTDTAGTNCSSMFFGCTNFNQDIGNWDVSKVTNMNLMFGHNSANSFNQNIGGWNVSNVTNFSFMFWSNGTNLPFNQNLGSWNVSKGTTFNEMFRGCVSVSNQDLRNWNIAGINVSTGLDNFMLGKTGANALSTTNYNSLLIGWNNNKLIGANGVANWRTDLRPNFGGATYSAGSAAATARAALVTYGWTITDGGSV